MGGQQLGGQVGVDVLGIERGFQHQRLTVDLPDSGELIDLGITAAKLQHFDDIRGGRDDGKLDEIRRRGQAHGGHFCGKGIDPLGFAMNLWLGNKRAFALTANHQTLGLQCANGLADGGAGDGKRLAEFGFGGQKISGNQNPCGNMALNDCHKLVIQRYIAVQREFCVQNQIVGRAHVVSPKIWNT